MSALAVQSTAQVDLELAVQESDPCRATASLDAAVQRARTFGVELNTVHTEGKDVGRSVCEVAGQINADLLVIASQDRRPLVARGLVDLDKLLGGSVSDYIRVHSPAPVLLVREPERQ